jgi:hypothetical protein
MNETKKTLIFCGAALVAAGSAWALYPKADTSIVESREGSLLFEGFTDPKSVTFLEIHKPSEQVQNVAQMFVIGRPERLALAQQPSGNWVVASREDYPAGVMDRVAEAASALSDLRIISIASQNAAEAGDHELFGVIDPLGSNVDIATTGIGLRITAKGGDKTLADLVIGKPVEGQTDVRYVRKPNDDVVYTAKIKDYSRLTTRFDDWIETRVLDVNSSFDVRRVVVKDETFVLAQRNPTRPPVLAAQQRGRLDLSYDNSKSQWTANEIVTWDESKGGYAPANLAANEELNTQALNDLTFGLSDLKVVDVSRKDPEIAKAIDRSTGEIRLEDFPADDPRALGPGFYALAIPRKPLALYAIGGEVFFNTKDGLEYTVRFGREAGIEEKRDEAGKKPDEKKSDEKKAEEKKSDEAKPDPSKKKEGEEKAKDDDTKVNRYMFVTVRFNEALIDKPKLEPVPGESPKDESPKKDDTTKKDAAPGEKPDQKTTEKKEPSAKTPEAEKKPETKAPANSPKTEAPQPDPKKSSQAAGTPNIQLAAYQADAAKTPDKEPEKTTEKKTDDAKSPPPKTDNKDDEAKKKADDEKKKIDDEKKKAEDERKRIKDENDKKIKEHEESLAKGRKRAKDLNDRFADWFYIISEDSYKKLHLTRADVVKKKEEKKEDDKKNESSPAIDPSKFNEKLGE